MPKGLTLYKSKQLNTVDPQELKFLVEFIDFAKSYIKLDKNVTITLLQSSPDKAITFGAYQPHDDHIYVIVQGRNFLDYARTLAHELVHQKQKYDGRLNVDVPEIGGEIEDEANYLAGRIVKSYIKTQLSSEGKKKFGLGTF